MWEMINNARDGFLSMHTYGKYTGLLIVLLLYLWCRKWGNTISRTRCENPEKGLLLYTTLMMVICSLPVTAVLLMVYQTAFYDYSWVWATVPVTIMLAYGGALLLEDAWRAEVLKRNWQKALFVGMFVLIFVMSGGMGSREKELVQQRTEYHTTQRILEMLASNGAYTVKNTENGTGMQDGGICIWGPTMVLEYVRMIQPEIRVAYGRNMWDLSLNAFAYDTYSEEETALYDAMCEAEYRARFQDMEMLDLAMGRGITHLILPGYVLRTDVDAAAAHVGTDVLETEGYFVLLLQENSHK